MKNFIDTYTNKDIKNIFVQYEAFDKSHTIDRNTLFREIESLKDSKELCKKPDSCRRNCTCVKRCSKLRI